MNADHPLVSARSSLVWIMAIVCAFGAVAWIEKESGKPLIAQDRDAARDAWRAVDRATMVPDAVSCTEGSYLMALVSAQRLGVLSTRDFDDHMSETLSWLARSPVVPIDALGHSRFAAALQVIASRYPHHAAAARSVAEKWRAAPVKEEAPPVTECDAHALMLESLAYTGGSR